MPTYVYKCENCEIVFEEPFVKYENRDAPTEHPCQSPACGGKINRIPAMPLFAYDNVGPNKKPDKAFNDKLKEIKRTHRGSNINVIE